MGMLAQTKLHGLSHIIIEWVKDRRRINDEGLQQKQSKKAIRLCGIEIFCPFRSTNMFNRWPFCPLLESSQLPGLSVFTNF